MEIKNLSKKTKKRGERNDKRTMKGKKKESKRNQREQTRAEDADGENNLPPSKCPGPPCKLPNLESFWSGRKKTTRSALLLHLASEGRCFLSATGHNNAEKVPQNRRSS